MTALASAYGVAHVVGPHWLNSGFVFNAIGLSAVVALLAGARRQARGRRLPWYLFALGQVFFVTGDVLLYNYERFFGKAPPFPSFADAPYLAFYLPLMVGLLLLIWERRGARDRGSLIDALTVTVAAAALSWTYLMAPYAHGTAGLHTKLVSIAYPLMDVLVLGVLVHLVAASGRRSTGFVLLVMGFTALLVSDSIYGWLLLRGPYHPGGLLDIGWASFYALLGATALHPSTRDAVRAQRRAGAPAHRQAHRIARCGNPDGPCAHAHAQSPRRAARRRRSRRRVGGAVRIGPDAHDRPRTPA